MNCRITMKCPDSLDQAIYEFVNDILDQDNFEDQEDYNYEHERLVEKYKEKAKKWFKYAELVTLEIDFDNMTCKVVN